MGTVETDCEAEAARVLQRFYGGSIVERDHGGAQVRDFDFVRDSAVEHAVEVTSVNVPQVRASRSDKAKLEKRELGLTASWSLTVHERVRLGPIYAGAPSLLNQLVALGVRRFRSDRLWAVTKN